MESESLAILCGTAGLVGLVHTIAGPDHYVPFIAMARIGRWSLARTVVITALCGLGHVAGSIALGGLGVLLGWALGRLEWFEGVRGELAGWLLVAFGLTYTVWGIWRAIRNRPHSHLHAHVDGTIHTHPHTHHAAHAHVHAEPFATQHAHAAADTERARRMTPWVLFTIFVLGPCEPLIPILMYPAAKSSAMGVVLVATVFALVTIATVLAAVLAGYFATMRISLRPLERYSHALAGGALLACGLAVRFGF